MRKKIYNLEFPPWCPEMNIFRYRFTRVDDYREKVASLQHGVTSFAEFETRANTGKHAVTAYVEIPEQEEEAILAWVDGNSTALSDILLLLSIFTCRDVFEVDDKNDDYDVGVILADSRIYQWGGVLGCSIPYEARPIDPHPFAYNIGFEKGLNQIYTLIRSEGWQHKYQQGYFLLLARQAFKRQILESAFIQCWTIWEHLFTILNQNWLSSNQILQLSSFEKIAFILVEYALKKEIDNTARERIKSLAQIRNRLMHFGRFPERHSVYDDAILFIHLTEFVIAKILGLFPSNLYNTIEKLEEFLSRESTKQSKCK
jgi:hypothetical protein